MRLVKGFAEDEEWPERSAWRHCKVDSELAYRAQLQAVSEVHKQECKFHLQMSFPE